MDALLNFRGLAEHHGGRDRGAGGSFQRDLTERPTRKSPQPLKAIQEIASSQGSRLAGVELTKGADATNCVEKGEEVKVGRYSKSLIVVTLIASTIGCGSQRKQEGIKELQRIASVVSDMNVVVSAGTTQSEFSRRLTDEILKMGDLEQSHKQTVHQFPGKDQDTVRNVYHHLSQAMEAYKASKEFFGDTHRDDLDPFKDHNLLGERKYQALQSQFPNLAEFKPAIRYGSEELGGTQYWRGDMLQALWKVARQEYEEAKQLIEKLAQQ